MADNNCFCNCFDDSPNYGDITINNTIKGSGVAYFGDFPARYSPTSAWASQGMVSWNNGQYVLIALSSTNNDEVKEVVIDTTTQTIVNVFKNIHPLYHYNGGATIGETTSGSGIYRTLWAALTPNNRVLYEFMVTGGVSLGGGTTYTLDRSCGAIAYDEKTRTIYGLYGMQVFTITLSSTGTATSELVFDGTEYWDFLKSRGYPSIITQDFCVKDDVFYITMTWPAAILKYSITGQFLGLDEIPTAVDGHVVGELESIIWSDYLNCFLVNSIGRGQVISNGSTNIFINNIIKYGEGVVASDPFNYSNQSGTTGSTAGNPIILQCIAKYNQSTDLPMEESIYHTGTNEHPYHYLSECSYKAAWLTLHTHRTNVSVNMIGDFSVQEDMLNISSYTRQYYANVPGVKIAGLNVRTGGNVTVFQQLGGSCHINNVTIERGAQANLWCTCDNIHILQTGTLYANELGSCDIDCESQTMCVLGSSNMDITFTTSGASYIFTPALFTPNPASSFSGNVKMLNNEV